MTGILFPSGKFQAIGNDGLVVPLGKLYIIYTATGLPVTTYRDSSQTSANTHPILLSASGKADVFLLDGIYDILLTDQYGETVWSIEGYISNLSNVYTKDETYSQEEIDALLGATVSEWLMPAFSVVYESSSTFTIVGDKTTIYLAERRLKINLSASSVYSSVLSSVYDAEQDITTVTTKDVVVTPTLTTVEHALITPLNLNGSVTPEVVGVYYDRSLVKNILTDGSLTLTTKENWYGRVEITDTNTILTGSISIILDNSEHTFLFINNTAQDLVVINSSGTGVTVPKNEERTLRNNTVNVILYEGEENIIHTSGSGLPNEIDNFIIPNINTSTSYAQTDGTSAINGSVVDITNGVFTYAKGKNNYGYARGSDTFTGSIDFTGVADGTKYVAKDELNNFTFYDSLPYISNPSITGALYLEDGLLKQDNVGLTNQVSFLDKKVQVVSETPQTLTDSDVPTEVVPKILEVGFIKSNENRKVIDLGTISNNNRYVEINPFGNENYMDCDVRCEIFANNRWFEPVFYNNSGAGVNYGVDAHSMEEGIVIQSANSYLWWGFSVQNGDGANGNSAVNLTSAQARAIVTYNGKAK